MIECQTRSVVLSDLFFKTFFNVEAVGCRLTTNGLREQN
jgi:hypothetical protein